MSSHSGENTISEDPKPAETSNQKNPTDQQIVEGVQSQLVLLAALGLTACIIITVIVVLGCVAICRIRRPKPEPEEVRKRIR